MRGVITLQAVKALRPGQELTDTRLEGFQVRRQGEAITYSVRRRLHGKNVRSTIGRHGPWTPDKARKEAEDRLRDLGKGVNPDIKRKGAGAAFAVVAPLFLQHVEEHLAASTHREYSGHVYDHLLPRFKSKPLDKIATAEVERLHLELKNRRTLANHILATLSSMYGWASSKYVPQGYNPCSGVKRFKETPRNCQLEDEAIERLMRVLRECEHEGRWSPFALAGIELYLLTGQRRDAIRLARWEHVNWERDEVKVHLKRQGLRTIRFNKQAMTVLRRLRDGFPNDGNPYIIRGSLLGEPYRNMQDVWDHVRQRAGLHGVRIHDLRHTVGSIVGETNNPRIVMEALGHTSVASAMRYIHARGDAVEREMKRLGAKIANIGKCP